ERGHTALRGDSPADRVPNLAGQYSYDDYRMWDTDRLHMSPLGHTRMAAEVLDLLGVGHDITPVELEAAAELTRREQRRQNAEWARTFLGPWVMRRARGISSGDGVTPRWPEPVSGAALIAR
ncbi:hypothetical protein R4227_17735, partial [Gordonia amicalis]|nr:hypothetical protein [Gordonia amicalis]MDV7101903.1 hypothetical protein [Gordonia amicalis]